jgi:hypothetical protein
MITEDESGKMVVEMSWLILRSTIMFGKGRSKYNDKVNVTGPTVKIAPSPGTAFATRHTDSNLS